MHVHHIHLMVLGQAELCPQKFLEMTHSKSARTKEVPPTTCGTFLAFGWWRSQQQWSDGQNFPCTVLEGQTDHVVTIENESFHIANVSSFLA